MVKGVGKIWNSIFFKPCSVLHQQLKDTKQIIHHLIEQFYYIVITSKSLLASSKSQLFLLWHFILFGHSFSLLYILLGIKINVWLKLNG